MKKEKSLNSYMNKKIKIDLLFKIVIWFFAILASSALFFVFGFILKASIPAFQHHAGDSNSKPYSFSDIFFKFQFDGSQNVGILGALLTTFVVSIIAIIIAAPLGIKFALFVTQRMPPKVAQFLKSSVEILAGIPSIIFGLFAVTALGDLFKFAFGWNTQRTMFSAIIMLVFMILPTITSVVINAIYKLDNGLKYSSLALGTSGEYTSYKIIKKHISGQILSAIILAISRAIGETIALSLVLTSSPSAPFSGGLSWFLSNNMTLSALISTAMFSDNGGQSLRGVLYAGGLALFFIVMILNLIILLVQNRKNATRFGVMNKISSGIAFPFTYTINWLREKIHIHFSKKHPLYKSNISKPIDELKDQNLSADEFDYEKNKIESKFLNMTSIDKYINDMKHSTKKKKLYSMYKFGSETILSAITLIFLMWIVLYISIQGFEAWNTMETHKGLTSTDMFFLPSGYNTIIWSIIGTGLLIGITLLIAFPICLFVAIYLSEYATNKKGKKTIEFFINSLSSTPSILFGLFGQVFFIYTLHLANNKTGSLLAGALTMVIVILPSYINALKIGIENTPPALKYGSLALASSKFQYMTRVCLPHAKEQISTATVLSIGRILSETAPIWLTMGFAFNKGGVNLMSPAQTLTIRIFVNTVSTANVTVGQLIAQQAAVVVLLLVIFIVMLPKMMHAIKHRYFFYKDVILKKKLEEMRG